MPPLAHQQSSSGQSQWDASQSHPHTQSTTPTRDHASGLSTPGRQFSSGYSTATPGPDSQRSNGETPIHRYRGKALRRRIRRAMHPCEGNEKVTSFLPDDKLFEIITTENVNNYLKDNQSTFHDRHEEIIRHVCGQRERSSSRRASRRIFAILLLMKEPRLILDFMEQGINDGDLPLTRARAHSLSSDSESGTDDDEDDCLARSTSDGPIIINKFRKWTYAQKNTFYSTQWLVQVPILLKGRSTPAFHPVHQFEEDVVLPWTEYEECYDGLSNVSRVKLHNAHCQLGVDDDQLFALKSLSSLPQFREQEFRLEVKALLKVKVRPHLAVGLLTSFEHRKKFHFLFRWADGGNLRDMWVKNPRPDLNHSRICWVAQQLHGLAYGLDGIHNTKMTKAEAEAAQNSPLSPDTPQQPLESADNSDPEDDEGKDYGRHGDIKPENILWFTQDASDPEFGILKLSDFGLTTFHRASTTAVKAKDVRVTNTYSAPEKEVEETLSRPFDVWSLGCISLEFVTWMLLGSKGLNAFADKRQKDKDNRGSKFFVDNFYTVVHGQNGPQSQPQKQPKVKASVESWIVRLKKRPQCSQFLTELLDYIQNNMLLVQKDRRDTAMSVSDEFKSMLQKCKGDEGYALRGGQTESHDRKTSSKSKFEDCEMGEPKAGFNQAKRKRPRSQFDLESHQGPASRTRSRLQ